MLFSRLRAPRALALVLAMGAAACGNLTVGGFGEASVSVSGDAPEDAQQPMSASAAPAPRMSMQSELPSGAIVASLDDDDDIEGHIEIEFSLSLIDESGGVVQLGDDELQVNVDLRGDVEAEPVDRQLIPAVRYVELRVVFHEIEVEVQGLVINGQVVPTVDIEIDEPTLVVTRSVDLNVQGGERVSLLVDLNSLTWLELVNPLTGLIDGTEFASLIDVAVLEP
jgi:hypothetical protein